MGGADGPIRTQDFFAPPFLFRAGNEIWIGAAGKKKGFPYVMGIVICSFQFFYYAKYHFGSLNYIFEWVN